MVYCPSYCNGIEANSPLKRANVEAVTSPAQEIIAVPCGKRYMLP